MLRLPSAAGLQRQPVACSPARADPAAFLSRRVMNEGTYSAQGDARAGVDPSLYAEPRRVTVLRSGIALAFSFSVLGFALLHGGKRNPGAHDAPDRREARSAHTAVAGPRERAIVDDAPTPAEEAVSKPAVLDETDVVRR